MTLEKAIEFDNNRKELIKIVIDNCKDYNECTKELLKNIAELIHERNKERMIYNYKLIYIIQQNNNKLFIK